MIMEVFDSPLLEAPPTLDSCTDSFQEIKQLLIILK